MADLPSKQVYQALIDKNISRIYHANSVATSCQFLRSRSLLSRGTVERRELKQTPQKTDSLDKKLGIWFDVFADTVDIHERAKQYNQYGPVIFVIDTDLIHKTATGRIWVTKSNPIYWSDASQPKWFENIKELKAELTKGDFGQMIVFRHCGGELPFEKYIKKIILDNPNVQAENGADFFSMAYGALRASMAISGIDIPIEERSCGTGCSCKSKYKSEGKRTSLMFDPLIY